MVLDQGARLALVGGVVGVALSLLLRRGLGDLVYGVGLVDPIALGGVALGLVGLAAGWGPARRATRVEPMEAMRGE